MRQRDPCEEVARRLHERDRQRVAARPDPGDVPGLAGEVRREPLDRARLARAAPAAAELGRESPLERVLERRRRHRLVRRGRKAEPVANAKRVRPPVAGNLRHRGGDLRTELLPGGAVPVRVGEEPRARRRLELLVGSRMRQPRIESEVLSRGAKAAIRARRPAAAAAAPAPCRPRRSRCRTRRPSGWPQGPAAAAHPSADRPT